MRIGDVARLVVAACVAASLVGCFEEKDSIVVYPDGSGKIHIHEKLGEQLTSLILTFAEDDQKKKEAIDSSLHKELSKWDGVVAWTDLKAELKTEPDAKEGRVILEATGWFEDVTKLGKVSADSAEKITWTKSGDGFTLEWTEDREKKEEDKDPLESHSIPKPEEMSQVMAILKDLRIERHVTMPGPITDAVGAKEKKDRVASSVVTGKELETEVADLMTLADALRKKVAAKETTKDKANDELRARMKKLTADSSGDLKLTCGAADVAAEQKAHREALESAKKSWDASEDKKKVEEARKSERASMGKPKPAKKDEHGDPEMPMPGGK